MLKELGIRRWVAWKLRCAAARIYDGEYQQTLTVCAPDGTQIVQWRAVADDYGNGVHFEHNGRVEGYTVSWVHEFPDGSKDIVSGASTGSPLTSESLEFRPVSITAEQATQLRNYASRNGWKMPSSQHERGLYAKEAEGV